MLKAVAASGTRTLVAGCGFCADEASASSSNAQRIEGLMATMYAWTERRSTVDETGRHYQLKSASA
jgi:hypothetical protein